MRLRNFERKWNKLKKEGNIGITVSFNNGLKPEKYLSYYIEELKEGKRVSLYGKDTLRYIYINEIKDVYKEKIDYKLVIARGKSMLPTIPRMALLKVHFFKKGEEKDLNVGDIVAYRYPHWWNGIGGIHRIIAIDGNTVFVKGDNEDKIEKVDMKRVEGRVILDGKSPLKIPFSSQ